MAYLQIAWHNFQRLPVTVTVIYKYICNITTYLEGSIICCLGKKANRPIVPAPKSIPFPNHLPCDGFLFINSVNLYIFLPPSNRTLMGQRDGKHRINPPPPVHDFFKIGVGGLRPNRRLLTPPPHFCPNSDWSRACTSTDTPREMPWMHQLPALDLGLYPFNLLC